MALASPFEGFDYQRSINICLFLVLIGMVYALYRAALPKPIPGIPYNEEASQRVFGDVKEMLSAPYRRQWIWSQPTKHNAPVTQVFLFPLRKPTVIISDYREVVDICSRRTKEFDRGTRNKECVGFTAPNFHFTMESRDPRFKAHRELLRDVMTPLFLKDFSAPLVYDRASLLVNLWQIKQKKSQGRPFSAEYDLYMATLDIICSVAFGMEDTKAVLRREYLHIESQNPLVPRSMEDLVEFEQSPADVEIEALLNIPHMLAIAQRSPLPALAQSLALLNPRNARAQWCRRALIRRQIKRSLDKLTLTGFNSQKSALDHLIWREMISAGKADRKPNFHSADIRDELLGFLLGGHDSTATVLSWWVKYMTDHQRVQRKLRNNLRHVYSLAVRQNRWPTQEEICGASIPYLDAVIEETLRYASVATMIVRRTTCDTQVLGHAIPKGTDILLPLTGPSINLPAQSIPESLRSPACREAKERVPLWGADVDVYNPERWLKTTRNEDGSEIEHFDPHAGPQLAFSAGPRQCFGKKLAYLELTTLVTLLIWNFELLGVEKELNGPRIVERLVNLPKQCYVKLKKVEESSSL